MKYKKTKKYNWGGVEDPIVLDPRQGVAPLNTLPTLQPTSVTSLNVNNVPSIRNLAPTTTSTYAAPTQTAPSSIPVGMPDLSKLYFANSVPTGNGSYAGMKEAYGMNAIEQGKQDSSMLQTAGSMWGPIGTGIAAIGGYAIDATARNKATRLKNTTVGWSPGQQEDAEAWFGNFNTGGGIYIEPSKRGTFTAAAKKRHMGVQEFASKVLANKENYSSAMVKKANFAHNAAKWHETGGDIQLSNDSFQVKGNPQTTDGNTYKFNEKFIKLDHNEVVKDNFVFSDSLKLGDRTFANAAKRIEKSTGNAQKQVAAYGDRISANTVKWNNDQMEMLKVSQEALAMAKGHRNPDGSTKQPGQYASGGPLPWDEFDVGMFQKLYNTYLRDAGIDSSKYISEDGKWGPQTEAAYKDYGPQIVNDWSHMFDKQYDASGNLTRPVSNADRLQYEMMTRDKTPLATLPYRLDGKNYRITENIANPGTYAAGYVDQEGKPFTTPPTPELPSEMRSVQNSINNPGTSGVPSLDRDYQSPFTVGDALQGLEVAQKFMSLRGGPEREKPYLDLTPVSKTSFDVRPQLAQSQRNLTNQMASLDTSNINLRRAFFNQAYANKQNIDSQILNQYQQLNNQAQVQYEDRLSNRKRYNIGQKVYTDDINARNRGQYNTLVDNAWTSLGNFGEQLNKKVYANDALRLYKTIYPKTADRALEALSKEDLLKLLRLGNYGSK